MALAFTFTWNPDREPSIRPTGATRFRFIGWCTPGDSDGEIDRSDFATDMRFFLEGLLEGFPEGWTPEERARHEYRTLVAAEATSSLSDEGRARLIAIREAARKLDADLKRSAVECPA